MCSVAALVAMVLSLAACGDDQTPQSIHIKGELNFPTATTLPEHANAEVSLVQLADPPPQDAAAKGASAQTDAADAMASKRIVVAQTLHDFAAMPVAFDLVVSNALLSPKGRYALTATVESKKGQLLWQTARPQVIKPQTTVSGIELTLQPSVWNDAAWSFVRLHCADGFNFAAAALDSRVALRLGKQGIELPAVTTASGRRYGANDVWFELRDKGAALHVDGATHASCVTSTQ